MGHSSTGQRRRSGESRRCESEGIRKGYENLPKNRRAAVYISLLSRAPECSYHHANVDHILPTFLAPSGQIRCRALESILWVVEHDGSNYLTHVRFSPLITRGGFCPQVAPSATTPEQVSAPVMLLCPHLGQLTWFVSLPGRLLPSWESYYKYLMVCQSCVHRARGKPTRAWVFPCQSTALVVY